MDITTNLDDYVPYNPDDFKRIYNPDATASQEYTNYRNYILTVIEETLSNYINSDSSFFQRNPNFYDFKSLAGQTITSLKEVEIFLNIEQYNNPHITIA